MLSAATKFMAHLSRFFAVGVANSALGYVTFAVLQLLVFGKIDFGYLFSLAGSYCVAVPVAFLLYRRFVFKQGDLSVLQITRFSAVYLASIALNTLSLLAIVETFDWSELWAQAAAMGLSAAASYFGHRYFSFRNRKED